MDTSLVTQAVALNAAQTQQSIETVVLKQAHEMQQLLVDMLKQAADSAPALAEGQGGNVDKYA